MRTENAKNRGYYKIEGAVRAFNFDFRNKMVLDIGSSTGGFTEFALDHGAARVIAVDKGTNQMKAPLRFDPRIELHEKTDIFDVGTDGAHRTIIDSPDVIVADVSFLPLTKILYYSKQYLSSQKTEFLVMFKPQFEASPGQLSKGIVKNEKIRRDIIKNFERWLKSHNFVIMGKHDNELRGKNGNLERFYYLKLEKNNHKRIIKT